MAVGGWWLVAGGWKAGGRRVADTSERIVAPELGRAHRVTGEEVPVIDDAPLLPGLQVLLLPGAGKLFTVTSSAV